MSPVHLAVLGDDPARVPIVDEPFWIGRDPGCDLCLWDLRVSRKHAKVNRTHGEYLLSSEGRYGVYVNGKKVPVMSLRHGDEISLTPPGEPSPIRLRFENDLEGTFVPSDASLSAAWAEQSRSKAREPVVVSRYEVIGTMGPDGPSAPRLARSKATGREVILTALPAVPVGAPADAWLRFVTAVAGAEHPSLARVVDGGIEAVEEGALRWMAVALVRGRPASLRIPEGPQSPLTVVRRLRGLAAGLHLLHSRGVVHGAVVPSHLLLLQDGGAVLTGYERAFLRRDGAFPTTEPLLDREYVAPEVLGEESRLSSPAADIYGVAAMGHALLAGKPPFENDAARRVPPTLASRGITVPHALEDALARGMDRTPGDRPTAEDLGQVFAFAEAALSKSSAAS